MHKCLFGMLCKICKLILWPLKYCIFMSGKASEKCIMIAMTMIEYMASGILRFYKTILYYTLAFLTTLLQPILIGLAFIWEFIVKCVKWCCPCFFKGGKKRIPLSEESEEELELGLPACTPDTISQSNVFKDAGVVKDVLTSDKNDKFRIESRVRFFDDKNLYCGGTVKWTGFQNTKPFYKLVFVRLDDGQQPGSTDGVYEGQRLMKAEPGVHYLMMSEKQPMPITLRLGDYCLVAPDRHRLCMPKSQGFIRRMEGSTITLIPYDMDYAMNTTMQSHSKFEFEDYLLTPAPPPVTDERSDLTPPISADKLDSLFGRNKGIQGQCNSCYLDTLLFSLFAFSDIILDDLLKKEHADNVAHTFYFALNCLRNQIVYPLRASHYVSFDHVDFMRRLISKETGKEQFEGETRDIPECMDALFSKIFALTPELAIGSFVPSGDAHFNESFTVEIISSEGVVPTTQNLLEKASLELEFCFREMPNFMLMQLPREADHSSVVIPSLHLDLKNILHRSVKECASCQRNAALQFSQLGATSGLASSFLCRSCAQNQGLDVEGARQLLEPAVPDGEEPDSRLRLAAVLCIEQSHYNCFARCEDRWVFFDSMSDQEELFDYLQQTGPDYTNNMKKFNIPHIQPVPNFDQWINQSVAEFKRDRLKSFLRRMTGDDKIGRRLFSYAYMCLYTAS